MICGDLFSKRLFILYPNKFTYFNCVCGPVGKLNRSQIHECRNSGSKLDIRAMHRSKNWIRFRIHSSSYGTYLKKLTHLPYLSTCNCLETINAHICRLHKSFTCFSINKVALFDTCQTILT